MTALALAHRLDRTLVIQARRETVFQFFTDTPQWAAWWGAGSTIDPKPGGRMLIRHPNGVEVVRSGVGDPVARTNRVHVWLRGRRADTR